MHKHGFSGPFFLLLLSSRHQKVIKWQHFSFKTLIEWKMTAFNEHFIILIKKFVIWCLFDDDLKAREQEPKKKESENPGQARYCFFSIIHYSFKVWKISHETNKKLVPTSLCLRARYDIVSRAYFQLHRRWRTSVRRYDEISIIYIYFNHKIRQIRVNMWWAAQIIEFELLKKGKS